MRRREERVFRLNDEITSLRRDEDLAAEELIMLQHIDDDAQRDAAVSMHPIDRADAKGTGADVRRIEGHIADLARVRGRLEHKRDRLIAKWPS